MNSAVIERARTSPTVSAPPKRAKQHGAGWLQAFILIEIGCQLLLLSNTFAVLRQPLRSLAFGVSLIWLVMLFRRGQLHPAAKAALVVLAITALEFFHPTTNSFLSGLVQALLYVAILAPLFWVPALSIDARALRRVILVMWIFFVASSAVGVLQIYFPGRFQPSLSTAIIGMGQTYVHGLEIQTASGARVFRPMGLTDKPGGAAIAGVYAGLFGFGFLLFERRGPLRWLSVVGAILGMMCLYLSQVRLFMIMFPLCTLALVGILLLRRETGKLSLILIVVPVVLVLSFGWAVALGGSNMTSRMQTLLERRPGEVYYKSRGLFLEQTVKELLPKYPLGAGLGRWGMVNSYFGKRTDPNKGRIWVEIQWTGWLLDGGVPLIAAYTLALGIVLWTAFRIARLRAAGPIWVWGAVILAYDLGVIANTFGSSPFIGQEGMEFWLLNGALFAAARTEIARRRAYLERSFEPAR